MIYNRLAFGIVVGRLRTRKGLSQEALSALAGISRSHLTLLESGKKTARLDTLWQLASALDVPPHELIRLTEEENRFASNRAIAYITNFRHKLNLYYQKEKVSYTSK